MLKTLHEPPPVGSLRESVLILVMQKLEDIEHARWKALVQVLVEASQNDVKQGLKAWEEYTKMAFPYLETMKNQEQNKLMALLQKEVGQGPLKISPMNMGRRVTSKLRQAADQGKESRIPVDLRDIYKKLGRSIPIHE